MRTPNLPKSKAGQAGFSMVEMLMTAFILAIGLLGLAMLQTMALSSSRGSRSLVTAAHVAETVMQQVEMEARLTWLNETNTNTLGANNGNLNLVYLGVPVGGSLPLQYNVQGTPVNAASTDPTQNTAFFAVTFTHLDDAGAATVLTGQVSDYQVTVQFADASNVAQAPVNRTVVLTQRLTHG